MRPKRYSAGGWSITIHALDSIGVGFDLYFYGRPDGSMAAPASARLRIWVIRWLVVVEIPRWDPHGLLTHKSPTYA